MPLVGSVKSKYHSTMILLPQFNGVFSHIRRIKTRPFQRLFLSGSSESASRDKKVNLPDEANVVIVGGGIIGTSVAYHLGKLGIQDVLLLERDRLTCGTTWHAAGLISTFGSLSSSSTAMRIYTKELYSWILPQETAMDTGFMPVGFIELACDNDRLHYYRRVAAFNRHCGIQVNEISPQEVRDRFPACRTDDVLAGFHVPTDGRVNPHDATMALAKGARQHGVRLIEGTTVVGVSTTNDTQESLIPSVTGVTTSCGHHIKSKTVVNCAGMWARQFGELAGVSIPNQAAEHYYLITDDMPDIDPSWPVIEDPSRCVYIRPEGGGLMFGLFEWEGASWNVEKVPMDFSFQEIEPDWERMLPFLEKAMDRVPSALNVGAKTLFCGPESFTPDGCPIIGEAPELRNYFVAAGLNSIGILTGGGVGKILAEWISERHPPTDVDVTSIHVDRFHKFQSNPEYRAKRAGESLGNTYKVHYPDHTNSTCRGAKKSVLHDVLAKEANAYFREVSGWESPSWYAPMGKDPVVEEESFGRESWFPYWEAEHFACRNDVALFDMSFMSKFMVEGRDAGKFLNRLSTANVDDECGRITYTQWLNEQGYLEADLTVTKLSADKFLVVATDTMHNHVYAHMRRRLSSGLHAFVTDKTGAYAQINLQGPRSRDLLQTLTSRNMSEFPFRRAAEIDIGLARLYCVRITYVGELGYELFIPVEQAMHVYDRIMEKAATFNLRHAGLKSLGSLRLEKGYRDYGHDIDNTDTILECGLGFTCDYGKQIPFIGQDQVLLQKERIEQQGGPKKRMVQVLLKDPKPLMYHGEVVWRNGERVGDIRSSSYGHTLGGAVGLSMLESRDGPIDKEYTKTGDWSVEIGSDRYACDVSLMPFYDPKNTRIKL